MKFSVSQTDIAAALTYVSKAASTRSASPITAGVLIQAKQDTVTFQATDLRLSIKQSVTAQVIEEGATVVAVSLCANIAKMLPNIEVLFEEIDTMLSISAGNLHYSLPTLPPDDFPEFPRLEATESFELPAPLLSQMVDKVQRITSKDTSRPILTGILLEMQDNTLRLIATDSFRLAVAEAHIETSSLEKPISLIASADALVMAVNVGNSAENIQIHANDAQVLFNCGTTTLVSPRIEGFFPNYKQLLPASCTTSVVLNKDVLQEALKRVSVVTTSNSMLKLSVDIDTNLLSLETYKNDSGNAKESFDVEATGQSTYIGLNNRYISDCLIAVGSDDRMTLELRESAQPAIFKCQGEIQYLYLLMPVRL